MAGEHQSRFRLGLERLETREQPSGTSLIADTAAYDPDHIIVKWKDSLPHASALTTASEPLGNGQFKLTLTDEASVPAAVKYFKGQSAVEFAQPDYKVKIESLPNDPSFASLWGLNNTGQSSGTANADINAPEAWNTNTGSGNMIVAVIDSGIDYTHPDLAANMWKNPRETAGNSRDDDGNGYKDDIYGWNFVNNTANAKDDNGHGTHVAGTIGAVGNNGIGVSGVNWKVKLMALKFLDKDGSGYMSNAVKALNYAVANGAKVVNNSYAGGGSDPAMQAAINAAKAKGVIFVAAAGNDGTNNDADPVYPANYNSDNVVTVAATDRNDKLAGYSNFGRGTVEIAAPGSSIYSTLPGNKYGVYSGTSMAAPQVAGAMALVWDAHPTWSYKQVIEAVLKTAYVLPTLTGKVATGRLDVGAAIVYSPNGTPPAPSTPSTPTPSEPPPASQTVSSTDVNKVVADQAKTISTIRIDRDFTISDVNVQLNITHAYDKDLKISLIGPDGTRVYLINQRGGTGDNLTNTVFDDEATAKITSGTAPFKGSYKPETALSQFKGKAAKGTWQLVIEDVARYDSGRLNSWSLVFGSAATKATVQIVPEQSAGTQRKFLSAASLLDASYWLEESRRKK